MNPDVSITNNGSTFSFALLTDAAKAWVRDNVSTEGWQWLGNTLVVPARCVEALYSLLDQAGFSIQ